MEQCSALHRATVSEAEMDAARCELGDVPDYATHHMTEGYATDEGGTFWFCHVCMDEGVPDWYWPCALAVGAYLADTVTPLLAQLVSTFRAWWDWDSAYSPAQRIAYWEERDRLEALVRRYLTDRGEDVPPVPAWRAGDSSMRFVGALENGLRAARLAKTTQNTTSAAEGHSAPSGGQGEAL